jgi:hypothetical protein
MSDSLTDGLSNHPHKYFKNNIWWSALIKMIIPDLYNDTVPILHSSVTNFFNSK